LRYIDQHAIAKPSCFPKLRVCHSGAVAMPESSIIERLEKHFGVPLQEGYGLSEATSIVTSNPNDRALQKKGTVGKALPGIQLCIRHPETLEALAIGDVGEVWVKGNTVCQGYWRNPPATSERITAEGWLRTGDIGFLDTESYLTLINRLDDVINVAGLKVYPREIESVLLDHPAIEQVAVFGMPCPKRFQQVVACIVLKPGAVVSWAELKIFCRQSLSGYKIPKRFHEFDTLPQTASGKIQRNLLRASLC
jgi:long-chain acyl-CoA synthetase